MRGLHGIVQIALQPPRFFENAVVVNLAANLIHSNFRFQLLLDAVEAASNTAHP